MTSFDFYFLSVLLAFTIGGFASGFISKLFGLIGLIASIWAGMRLGSVVEPFFVGFLNNPMLRALLASIFASVVVYAFTLVLGNLLTKAIKSSAIAPIDRTKVPSVVSSTSRWLHASATSSRPEPSMSKDCGRSNLGSGDPSPGTPWWPNARTNVPSRRNTWIRS